MAVWLLTIFFLISSTVPVPLILTDTHTSCEFTFLDKKKIQFSSKLRTVETPDFILHFSLCKSPQAACRNETSSCLYRKNSTGMINLGHEFIPADSDDPILVSLNGDKCPKFDQNYSISITLDCSELITPKPRLLAPEINQCSFEITMMKPDCLPRCTETVQDALIDIRKFPKNIHIQSDLRRFSVSLCGSNKNCGGDVSACEINQDGTVTPLASIDSQMLVFNYGGDESGLTARGKYTERGEHRDVHILIKCNWETELANPIYKKVITQGSHYRFELESSYGCIKLSHNCLLTSIHNLNYDLRKLDKLEGWTVRGVPQGKIILNICGPLKLPPSLCSAQHSQVCHISGKEDINRGSILSRLEASDEFITATFTSGSRCQKNASLFYSTEIKFKCFVTEKGPVFIEFKDCYMFLIWETPHACPVDFYKSQNCYLHDRLSNRNFKQLHTDIDRTYSLAPHNKTVLIYNICGPIHQACDNLTNVSFCLMKEKKQIVIGYDSREILSDKGLLKMEFRGNSSEVTVKLICSYENPLPSPELQEVEKDKYLMTLFTPLACMSQAKFTECIITQSNQTYDLSPLLSKTTNYVIPGDHAIEYIFNICGPVISGPGALCRGDTMFCKRNKTELNLNNQFVSLGGVAGPRLQGRSLIIEARMGSFCAELGYYKSVIYFECSETNFPPKFVSQDSCTYNFEWKTPHACPLEQNITIENLGHRKQKHVAYLLGNVTLLTTKPPKLEINCAIFEGFNLNELGSQVILHQSNKFQINFDQEISQCVGVFCKNYITLVPQMCPVTSFNYSSQFIKLQFSGQNHCGDSNGLYEFEVLLRCGKQKTSELFEDEKCKTVVLYNLPEACVLLKQETVATTTIAGIVIGVLLLIFFAFLFYLNRRRCSNLNMPRCNSKSSVTIYLKDITE